MSIVIIYVISSSSSIIITTAASLLSSRYDHRRHYYHHYIHHHHHHHPHHHARTITNTAISAGSGRTICHLKQELDASVSCWRDTAAMFVRCDVTVETSCGTNYHQNGDNGLSAIRLLLMTLLRPPGDGVRSVRCGI